MSTECPRLTFHHGGVSVPNLDQAIDWYGNVLGFKEEARFDIPGTDTKVAMLVRDQLRFEIFQASDSAPVPEYRKHPKTDFKTQGNLHVAMQIDDLDAFLEYVEKRGADVALIVREKFGKGCFLRDCAGNLIEFVESK